MVKIKVYIGAINIMIHTSNPKRFKNKSPSLRSYNRLLNPRNYSTPHNFPKIKERHIFPQYPHALAGPGNSSGYAPSPCTTSGPGFGYATSAVVFGVWHPLPVSAIRKPGRWEKGMLEEFEELNAWRLGSRLGWECGW